MIMEHAARVRDVSSAVSHAARQRQNVLRRAGATLNMAHLLGEFAPISLAQMERVALQDRIDTKYVLHVSRLDDALVSLAAHYSVLEINGIRQHRYQTLYFDTADFALYRQHHAGGRNRYKVRSRSYLDTALSCLEIKFKAHSNRTIKQRLRTPEVITAFSAETSAFLRAHLPPNLPALQPQLWNDFSRITLVGKQQHERVTLDVGLRFSGNGDAVALPGIVVAEVKQGGHGRFSPFMRVMRDRHIRSMGFSKYCIGVSLLYPTIKHNNFKPHQRLLHTLIQGGSYDIY